MIVDPKDAPTIPATAVIDGLSGYNAAMPATQQGYPRWWQLQPDLYASFLRTREAAGLRVDDGIAEWEAALEAETQDVD